MKNLSEDDALRLSSVTTDSETDTSYMAFKKAIANHDDKKEKSK